MIHPTAIFDPQKRSRLFAKLKKTYQQTFSPPVKTKPVFVLGTQRSGTTMLMFTFHLHPAIAVYDESLKNVAFADYRLRSLKITEKILNESPFQVAVFKPLADSHLVDQLMKQIPSSKIIWALRNYTDVANSSLRKFPHATKAIRLVCKGKKGGGWFQDGISEETNYILRNLPWQNFSDFDFACLVWWARNRLFFEQNLHDNKKVTLLHYEKLVNNPENSLRTLTNFMGTSYFAGMIRHIHIRSIARHSHPDISISVRELCEEMTESFAKINDK